MIVILLHSLLAGLGTCLGAVMVLLLRHPGRQTFGFLLAAAAGIMASVVMLDLLPTSLRQGELADCAWGFAGGLTIVSSLDYWLGRGASRAREDNFLRRTGYLIALGIALHDVPEGLAITAGHFSPGKLGPLIALAIGLHNIPEGMANALPLRAGGVSSARILALNALLSTVTPLGALLGVLILHVSPALIGTLLAFAAGAMTYIVLGKLVPASKGAGRSIFITGATLGFFLMSTLKLFFEE